MLQAVIDDIRSYQFQSPEAGESADSHQSVSPETGLVERQLANPGESIDICKELDLLQSIEMNRQNTKICGGKTREIGNLLRRGTFLLDCHLTSHGQCPIGTVTIGITVGVDLAMGYVLPDVAVAVVRRFGPTDIQIVQPWKVA